MVGGTRSGAGVGAGAVSGAELSYQRLSDIVFFHNIQNININIISSLPCLIRMRELWEVVFLHTMNYASDVVKYYHAEINIMYASVANISLNLSSVWSV